jgi:release factor glutamine methyltransferase
MPSLIETLRTATEALAAARIPDPEVDARILLCAAAGIDRVTLIRHPDLGLAPADAVRLDAWICRRQRREPVSRILECRDFWGLTLRVTPDVLDPRPDTETLVEAVLEGLRARRAESLRLLDLGTGSGAILCALLTELPRASGWGVDRSAAACRVARDNLARCGLAARSLMLQGDWAGALAMQSFDVVVSNPPYIETALIPVLDIDVRGYDPVAALDGGPDGLAAYRTLAAELPRLLAPGGFAAFEVGRGQDRDVAAFMTAVGLSAIATRRDVSGIERVVTGWR